MTLIVLEKASGLAINPADISTMRFNRSRHLPTLEIVLRAGEIVQVEHRPNTHDGADIHQLHKQLLEVA